MIWLRLALANLKLSWLTTFINIVLMALGTASIVLLLLAGTQLTNTLTRDAEGIDLVIGASGSPTQLILASVYHADIPPGNISWEAAQHWLRDERVAVAAPLALGDSYRGSRVVGTNADYFVLMGASLAEGGYWDAPMEAVLGASAAIKTGLSVGDSFFGSHGITGGAHDHGNAAYRVVGVLEAQGSAVDRLIFTSMQSVWELHEEAHEQEVTAVLLRYRSPLAALSMPREVNASTGLQSAAPAVEISRLLQLMGLGLDALRAFAWVLIATACLSVFAALYGSLRSRRGDLAMLRCLGASRVELFSALILEGLLLSLCGVALGFLLGHLAMASIGSLLESSRGVSLSAWQWLPAETILLVGLFGVSVVSASLPAWQAYRTNVAETLAGTAS
ncbi:MAG: ABC transporter permease [Congregibacter sp.]